MCVILDLQMLTSVPIGGPPIEVADPIIVVPTLSCRNMQKPTKAKWLLGKEYLTQMDIECNGR